MCACARARVCMCVCVHVCCLCVCVVCACVCASICFQETVVLYKSISTTVRTTHKHMCVQESQTIATPSL